MAWRSFKSMGSMYRQRRVFGTESTRQLHQWDGYDTNYEARSLGMDGAEDASLGGSFKWVTKTGREERKMGRAPRRIEGENSRRPRRLQGGREGKC